MIAKVFKIGHNTLLDFLENTKIGRSLMVFSDEIVLDFLAVMYFKLCLEKYNVDESMQFKLVIPAGKIDHNDELFREYCYIRIFPQTMELINKALDIILSNVENNKNSREDLITFMLTDIIIRTTAFLSKTNMTIDNKNVLDTILENDNNRKIKVGNA